MKQPSDLYLNAITDKDVKKAVCSIDDDPRQPCAFLIGPHGSFGIITYDGQMRNLKMTQPGVGRVTALKTQGPTDIGVYTRSKANPACWMHDDPAAGHSQICVW